MITDTLIKKIDLFLLSNQRNSWINFEYGKVYVRKSNRFYNTYLKCLDIASIELDEIYQNKGFFKEFLNKFIHLHPETNIFVESILNDKFYLFLQTNGFKIIDNIESKNLIYIPK